MLYWYWCWQHLGIPAYDLLVKRAGLHLRKFAMINPSGLFRLQTNYLRFFYDCQPFDFYESLVGHQSANYLEITWNYHFVELEVLVSPVSDVITIFSDDVQNCKQVFSLQVFIRNVQEFVAIWIKRALHHPSPVMAEHDWHPIWMIGSCSNTGCFPLIVLSVLWFLRDFCSGPGPHCKLIEGHLKWLTLLKDDLKS